MILFLSCYELGHPPHSVALALGLCANSGIDCAAQDLSVERLSPELLSGASLIVVSAPMHTALRLGLELLPLCKRLAPNAKIAFYGLYASLNEEHLFSLGVDFVIGGEAEAAIVLLYQALSGKEITQVPGVSMRESRAKPIIEKLPFVAPAREKLPPLERYAKLDTGEEQRIAGYTEASRGCLHKCTHCPIPPVYKGRFFVIPASVVLSDIEAQVAQGASHITFGDPDFLNGPKHAISIARALHKSFPSLTFDFTAKVEHLLRHRELLPELVSYGAIFVVSAFESLSDEVLFRLQKGHTRADILAVLPILADAKLPVRPTWVPFTPWSSLDDICALFAFAQSASLVENIDPIQYTIRLLIPPGSLLLQDESLRRQLSPLDANALAYPWRHPEPAMDALCSAMQARVELGAQRQESNEDLFLALRALAFAAAGREAAPFSLRARKRPPPRLTEAWFC